MLRELDIPADWVADGETGTLPKLLGSEIDPAEARQLQGSFTFMFPELEVEDVRIFDMPGVVAWLALLHERIPHLVYFLQPAPQLGALEGLLRTLVPPKVLEDEPAQIVLTDEIAIKLAAHLVAAALFAIDHGDDWERFVTGFIEPLDESAKGVLLAVVREHVSD